MKKLTVVLFMALLVTACGTEPDNGTYPGMLATNSESSETGNDTSIQDAVTKDPENGADTSGQEMSDEARDGITIQRFRSAIEKQDFYPDGGKYPLDISVEDRELDPTLDKDKEGLVQRAIVKNRSQLDDQDLLLIYEFDNERNAENFFNKSIESEEELGLATGSYLNGLLVMWILDDKNENLEKFISTFTELTP